MATKVKDRSKAVRAASRRTRNTMSREARVAYRELQQGVTHLGKSIADIQRGLRRAEQKIEADAREQIRQLRKEARVYMSDLKAKQREVSGSLRQVSAAVGDSWKEIKLSIDAVVVEARATGAAVIERFRGVFDG